MKQGKKHAKLSRKKLADSKLGISYKERLEKSNVKVRTTRLEIIDNNNGYSTLIRLK